MISAEKIKQLKAAGWVEVQGIDFEGMPLEFGDGQIQFCKSHYLAHPSVQMPKAINWFWHEDTGESLIEQGLLIDLLED